MHHSSRFWFGADHVFLSVSLWHLIDEVLMILDCTSHRHGVDIRFHGPSTMCITDAAFHHTIYRTLQHTSTAKLMAPPPPYIPPSAPTTADQKQQQQQEKGSMETTNDSAKKNTIAPVNVTQQVICKPFAEFDKALENVDQWIFVASNTHCLEESVVDGVKVEDGEPQQRQQPWYLSGQYCWPDTSEPSVVPFEHGLLCSASLCRNVLLKLQHSCLSDSPVVWLSSLNYRIPPSLYRYK